MTEATWRTRITITLHPAEGEAKTARARRVAAALRKSGLDAGAAFIDVVVIRRMAATYAADPISAQIAALSTIYTNWPRKEPLPGSQVLSRTTYEPGE